LLKKIITIEYCSQMESYFFLRKNARRVEQKKNTIKQRAQPFIFRFVFFSNSLGTETPTTSIVV